MNARPGWLDHFVSFDVETTGVDVEEDRIVTATVTRIEGARVDVKEWLINPGVEIPAGATAIHGISTERACEEGVAADQAIAEIVREVNASMCEGRAFVIYNAPFDLTMLDREARRYGVELKQPVGIYDPLVIDKQINRFVKGKGQRQLVNACKRNGIVLSSEEAHTSRGDTLAAGRLAWMQAGNPRISSLSLAELETLQRTWYAEQSRSYARYLDTKGGDPDGAQRVLSESTGWPMRPYVQPEPQAPIPF